MSEVRELYQELIVEHSKKPRNFGKLDGADHEATGYNPLCGDKVTVYLKDLGQFAEMNEVYEEYFAQSKPARTTVEVSNLPLGVGIEVDAIAGVIS